MTATPEPTVIKRNVRVCELVVGDVVSLPGTDRSGTFLGRSDHPKYPTLQAAVWRMENGEWFIDALSALQEVGDVVRADSIDHLLTALQVKS